jgi:enterochelin esterase-like enzyme
MWRRWPRHGRQHARRPQHHVTACWAPRHEVRSSPTRAPEPWAAAGYSNGGAWTIAAAQRRPDLFTAVAALSVGMVPRQLSRQARTTRVRRYLAAGTLETGFRRATRQWAERLQRAGLPCHYREWVGGHDPCWWQQQLRSALAWLLAPTAEFFESSPGPV